MSLLDDLYPRLEDTPPNSGLMTAAASTPAPAAPAIKRPTTGEAVKSFTADLLFSLAQSFSAGHERGAGIGAALAGPMVRKSMLQQQAEQTALKEAEIEKHKAETEKLKGELAQQGIRLIQRPDGSQKAIKIDPLTYKVQDLGEVAPAEQKPPEPFTLSEGQSRFDEKGNLVASVGKTEKPQLAKLTPENVNLDGKPARVWHDEYGNYFDQDKKPITGRITPYVAPPTPRAKGEITPTAESNLIQGLNKQWETASKDVQQLYRANTVMDAGMDAARKGDLNAGSQAVLVTFQKFLDPTSVVRESEYARSGAGIAMAERVRGAIEKLQKGGAGVPLAELETFAKLGKEINTRLAAEGNSLLSAEKERITKTAERYGIPSELVIPKYDISKPGGSTQPPTASDGWKVINVK